MPHRLQIIGVLLESFFLTIINAMILITWFSMLSAIPIILSSLWSIGRIKRDIDKYHNGVTMDYLKYLVGKVKKN